MTIPQTKQLINLLLQKGIPFEPGLSDAEVALIKEKFGDTFPPDLKRLLQLRLPVGKKFVNWRKGLASSREARKIGERLNQPWEDVQFEIRRHGFWVDAWGDKPEDGEEAIRIAKRQVDGYPQLIPVFAHRFIPGEPEESGNPVFSMYGMDIIYYGNNLANYFSEEFEFKLNASFPPAGPPREIEFWSWCVHISGKARKDW